MLSLQHVESDRDNESSWARQNLTEVLQVNTLKIFLTNNRIMVMHTILERTNGNLDMEK